MSKSGFSYPDRILVRIRDFQTKLGESWQDQEDWTVCSQYKMKIKWPKVQYCKLYIKCTYATLWCTCSFALGTAIRKVMGPGEGFWAIGIFFLNIYSTCRIIFFIPCTIFLYVLCPPHIAFVMVPPLLIKILYKQSTVFFFSQFYNFVNWRHCTC